MTASELIKLIHNLHHPAGQAERDHFYQALQPYLLETDYDWQEHMNDPAEEGLIWSGVYLAWAQNSAEGIYFWDTTGSRYLLPPGFTWENSA